MHAQSQDNLFDGPALRFSDCAIHVCAIRGKAVSARSELLVLDSLEIKPATGSDLPAFLDPSFDLGALIGGSVNLRLPAVICGWEVHK